MGIDDNQTVDTVVEGRIDIEIQENHPSRLAEFGILLVEWRYGGAEIIEQGFQFLEVGAIIFSGKFFFECLQGMGEAEGITGTADTVLACEIEFVKVDEQLLGQQRHGVTDTHRSEQVAVLAVSSQKGTDSEPEVIETN